MASFDSSDNESYSVPSKENGWPVVLSILRSMAKTYKNLMASLSRNIVKMFCILWMNQQCCLSEQDARKFPYKAVWENYWIPTWAQMMIQLDPWSSNTTSLNTMEFMLTFPSLLICWIANNCQTRLWIAFCNSHYMICFNNSKVFWSTWKFWQHHSKLALLLYDHVWL